MRTGEHGRAAAAFERRVRRALTAAGGRPDEPLLVACSGGPDSSAALLAVARTHADPRLVTAAYFDHGWRPAAETTADRHAVRALAHELGASFRHGAAPGSSPLRGEAASRRARYTWLAAACREAGAAACVVGHTRDDQAETVLLRLARGTGLGGAAGMAASAPWPQPGGRELRLLRPLLAEPRAAVTSYLRALRVAPRLDPTNELVELGRNRVRLRVLPELRALNPRVDAALAGFAARAAADAAALDQLASERMSAQLRHGEGWAELDRAWLRKQPRPLAARALRAAAASAGLALGAAQLAQALDEAAQPGTVIALRGGALRVLARAIRIESARRPTPAADRGLQSAAAVAAAVDGE